MHQLLLLKQKGLTLMDAAKQNLGYDPVALGERIAHIRKANNLTQENIAELLNVSVSKISHIETGKTVCSLSLLLKLADVFHISITNLLDGVIVTGIDKKNYCAHELSEIIPTLSTSHRKLLFQIAKLLSSESTDEGADNVSF